MGREWWRGVAQVGAPAPPPNVNEFQRVQGCSARADQPIGPPLGSVPGGSKVFIHSDVNVGPFRATYIEYPPVVDSFAISSGNSVEAQIVRRDVDAGVVDAVRDRVSDRGRREHAAGH